MIAAGDLPRLTSTRDTRDRVDLVTEELFGLVDLRADRITYHPGDTAAAHDHTDAKRFMIEGKGILHAGEESIAVGAGDVALVAEYEAHWLENPHDDLFTFIELRVPAPADTVWVSEDRCTWAPAAGPAGRWR